MLRTSLVVVALCLLSGPAGTAAWAIPGPRFDELSPADQQALRARSEPPSPAERRGPYSTPMYYLMHKGYAYEGNLDAAPTTRFYDKKKGTPGRDWGSWTLDRNRPDWQEKMIEDWAELGLNQTHFNVYPVGGKLEIDPDWAEAVRQFVALSEKHGLQVGVRLDAIDETKLWTVHPHNPQSQRAAYLKWVAEAARLLKGRTRYYILGDELTLKQPAPDLLPDAWTPQQYLAYFDEVASAIKGVDPTAKVCMFAASSGQWYNVLWLLENGYAERGDGIGINHYDYNRAPSFFADRDRLAPGKMFLTSGVGYISNGTIADRYPEGDGYSASSSEEDQAARIAKTMFVWWDLGADTAPYYVTLRKWVVDGQAYPHWFGFFGVEDYVIENDQLTVRRHLPWYAIQTVTHTFYNRDEMRKPGFGISSSADLSMLRAFERFARSGDELALMLWNDRGEVSADIVLDTDRYGYPVSVSLADRRNWTALDCNVDQGKTTLRLNVGPSPRILRMFAH